MLMYFASTGLSNSRIKRSVLYLDQLFDSSCASFKSSYESICWLWSCSPFSICACIFWRASSLLTSNFGRVVSALILLQFHADTAQGCRNGIRNSLFFVFLRLKGWIELDRRLSFFDWLTQCVNVLMGEMWRFLHFVPVLISCEKCEIFYNMSPLWGFGCVGIRHCYRHVAPLGL